MAAKRPTTLSSDTSAPAPSVNIAVVRGTCSSAPDVRVLPSGSTLALLQVTTRTDDGETTSVPVALWDPPAGVVQLDAGDEVVAVGRVRRRFFQAGGATASRVELEAATVTPARDRRRVQAALRRAAGAIAALEE
jgi:single-strand DNA-binding protein